jgi:hypothetical protein
MATAPQINLRDGSGTSQTIEYSTNMEFATIEGTIDTTTVDLQVSVNGSAFVSDPTLVKLDAQTFIVPNPASLPDGLSLDIGINTIQLRAIGISGDVSAASTATITRLEPTDDDGTIPSGIRVRRHRNYIDILVAKPQFSAGLTLDLAQLPLQFRGFNIYASAAPGGTTGYFKVNESLLTEAGTYEEDTNTIQQYSTVFEPEAQYVRVVVTQEDEFGNEIHRNLDSSFSVLGYSNDLRFSGTLDNRKLTEFISFSHNRSGGAGIINSDRFLNVQSTDPLYYVVTAVYYDADLNREFETPYSQEVLGAPLIIDTNITDLPGRNQLQIITSFVDDVQRVNQEISLLPGSTTRDVSIDPFSSEAERIWFIIDFVHRSQSFVTLLQIDDSNGDGVSDLVSGSAYKTALKAALGYSTDSAVQQLIDAQFDKLAKNVQKTRLPGRQAVGEAVFYKAVRPTEDITIASGTTVSTNADSASGLASVRFVVGGTYVMVAANADAYYNFDNQRYEITTDISAETIGSAGNRPAGSIKNVQGSVGGLQVTNVEATVFGNNRESNAALAARAQLGFVSVDTGTEGGYQSTSAEQTGIIKSKIVKSGDPLMMRDWDEVRKKHIGGKVDIWIQGLRERTVTERFAFTFEIARDIRCEIIDLANLIFRVQDSRVTVDTPIMDILNDSVHGLGVRNVTLGLDYDLTGVTILDYETFQIDNSIPQPATAIDDIITADYRFRSINQFTFSLQPVRRVVSVVGTESGALDNSLGYDLYKTDDPLLDGESTIAQNYLVINQVGGIPTGATIPVNGEEHVLIGFFQEPLGSVGINTATLRVFSEDGLIEYDGPSASSPDYEIVEGTSTTPIKIVRTASSAILSGQTVSVDYDHDENFTVTYVINDLVQELQRTVNTRRHTTADVLVKQAVENELDLETTVQLKLGAKKDKADPAIRSSVSIETNSKIIGAGLAQSDVIQAVDSTEGVDFQVLPLAQMGYSDGSLRLREAVLSSYVPLPYYNTGANLVYLLTNPLQYPTTDGGGLEVEHKGVFQDDEAMLLATSLAVVKLNDFSAWIIGDDGAVIPEYSDDATLVSEGFTDPDDIETERLRRTANHIVVSIAGGGTPVDTPANHSYAVSYVVRNDKGPHNIVSSDVEHLSMGNFTLTCREVTS